MSQELPAPIDRATFERVLQRAAELQASTRDIGEGMSEEELLALGKDVGLSEVHLRQALLEERARPTPLAPPGALDRLIARAELQADRVVQGSEEQITAAITRYLERNEHFIVQRATLGRTTFEPMDTFIGTMRRVGAMFDPSRAKPYLDKVDLLTAVVTPLEPGFCHVTLGASLRKSRNGHLIGASVLTGLGAAGAAGLDVMGGIGALAMVPAGMGALFAWLSLRAYRPTVERTQLGLERALDLLERNPPVASKALPSESAPLARGVGRVVRDITREVRKALDE
jgi:hypothetical protein